MDPPQLQLAVLAAWALTAGVLVLADIAVTGPYVVDFETFSPCDEVGSLLVKFDVKLVDRDGKSVYEGNLTFPYDVDDETLLSDIRAHRWGSTGGWSSFYNISQYDIIPYMQSDFPKVFELVFGAMGITGKPAPAGTYRIENFKPTGFKLKNLNVLPYGLYRFMMIQSKNGIELCCLQFVVNVKEDPAMGGTMKAMSPFG